MLTVEQLRQVRPDEVARTARELTRRAERLAAAVDAAHDSAGQELAGWHGPAATASGAHRNSLADDAGRLWEAHADTGRVVALLAERLDEARQLLRLADSFAELVGCRVHDRAEVTPLPADRLGPLATVYDSVRRTAGSLAAQALVVAEAADLHTTQALGEPATACGPTPPLAAGAGTADAGDDVEALGALVERHSSAAELAAAVHAHYRTMSAARRGATRARAPELIADLPGAPLGERCAATRQLIDDNRALLRRSRTELAGTPPAERSVPAGRALGAINQRIGTLNTLLAVRTLAGIDPATGRRRTITHERRFLAFDASGAGRVAEVIGDPTTAASVAVLVPGGRNSLDTCNALATDARVLADTAGPGVAVVVWLGYDSAVIGGAPEVRASRARTGGTALRRFLAGLRPTLAEGAHTVLVGHGFGSMVVAAALRAGSAPDDAVFVGSPGLGARITSAADLRPARPAPGDEPAGTRYWVLRAPGDRIAYSRAGGPDPAEFDDVTRLDTQGGAEVVGHARYYAVGSESLDNLARVVAGRPAEVTVTDTTLEEELLLSASDETEPPAEGPLDGVLDPLTGAAQ